MLRLIKSRLKSSTVWKYSTRARIAYKYFKSPFRNVWRWIPLRTESDNFYYSLTDTNLKTLASTISVVTKQPQSSIQDYITEITGNQDFKNNLRDFFSNNPQMLDSELGLGRRIGWYAVVRAIKPKLVVETGVHHGVGASIICQALLINEREGYPGDYLGTDYDLQAGGLVKGDYATVGRVLYGDSIESLERITRQIDLFINDSDHSSAYEGREYAVISSRLAENSIILGDNSHVTSELLDYSIAHSRKYLFFKEEPKNHWYPGGGIGFSFK